MAKDMAFRIKIYFPLKLVLFCKLQEKIRKPIFILNITTYVNGWNKDNGMAPGFSDTIKGPCQNHIMNVKIREMTGFNSDKTVFIFPS